METRTFTGLVSGLACLGVAQVLVLGSGGSRVEPQAAPVFIAVDIGAMIETHLASDPGGMPARVNDLGGGAVCTFAVVYSRTCSASLNAARSWTSAAARGALDEPGPAWRVVWIADDEGEGSAGALPEGFPVPTFEAVSDGQLLSDLGVGAWPVFVSLDREGRVVSKGVGAPLPSELVFGGDCSVVAR